MNEFQLSQQYIKLMKRILSVWTWMGKGLSSMALSPTMESPTSDDVFQHVKGCKEKGKTWWWQCVRVVLVSLKGNSEAIDQLQCKCCDTFFSPFNPSNACKTHLKTGTAAGTGRV